MFYLDIVGGKCFGVLTYNAPRKILADLAVFQVVYAYNANETTHCPSETPWYEPLCGSFMSVSGFRQTRLGRICTHGLVATLETLRIAPKGSTKVRTVMFLFCVWLADMLIAHSLLCDLTVFLLNPNVALLDLLVSTKVRVKPCTSFLCTWLVLINASC